jgi:hypothetical protein
VYSLFEYTKIPENILGPAKNILSNQFIIDNNKRSAISQKLRKSEEILPSGRCYFGLFSRGAPDPRLIFLQDIDLVKTHFLPLNCKDK